MLTQTKFWVGVSFVALSLILGKVMLLLFLSPTYQRLGIALYVLSWPLLFIGLYWCGKEGLNLIHELAREYTKKAVAKTKVGTVAQVINSKTKTALQKLPQSKFPHKR